MSEEALEKIMAEVEEELRSASDNFAPFNSAHEGCAVIREEFEELWQEVKKSPFKREDGPMRLEAIQLAAMAVRFVHDVCEGTPHVRHE